MKEDDHFLAHGVSSCNDSYRRLSVTPHFYNELFTAACLYFLQFALFCAGQCEGPPGSESASVYFLAQLSPLPPKKAGVLPKICIDLYDEKSVCLLAGWCFHLFM